MRGSVGKVRVKLAKMIAAKLTELGRTARCDPSNLFPNQGYWRTDPHADVMPWSGQYEWEIEPGRWVTAPVESWSTMTDLIRGFDLNIEGFHVELYALEEAARPSKIQIRAERMHAR
jgi:hypothetical protein